MKTLAVLLMMTACLAAAYQFDRDSCRTWLPSLNHSDEDSWFGQVSLTKSTQDIAARDVGMFGRMHQKSEETSEEDEDDEEDDYSEYEGVLLPALERSPYRLSVSSLNYRRNRVQTVTIEGPEFNGAMIHAVRRFPSSFSSRPSVIGNFLNLPVNFDTMDCNFRRSDAYSANTAFTTSRQSRKNLELQWKAPSEDYDSIEFKATIVRGKYYWTHNKSPPLFFNHFPPSLAECGEKKSCLQYSLSLYGCGELCDYIVISEVHGNNVHFHIGGKLPNAMTYIGVGFTTDKEKLSYVDIYACVKRETRVIDAVHYIYDKSLVNLEKSINLDNIELDKDGDYIWCKFTRPLRYWTTTSAVDLSKEAYQAILWGSLDFVDNQPILEDESKIVQNLEPWNCNRTLNIIQKNNGPIWRSHWWVIVFSILATHLLLI